MNLRGRCWWFGHGRLVCGGRIFKSSIKHLNFKTFRFSLHVWNREYAENGNIDPSYCIKSQLQNVTPRGIRKLRLLEQIHPMASLPGAGVRVSMAGGSMKYFCFLCGYTSFSKVYGTWKLVNYPEPYSRNSLSIETASFALLSIPSTQSYPNA